MVPHPAVLLVIGDHDLRAILRGALERRGETVESARDAVEAAPLLERSPFDAVVIDTAMDKGSAADVLDAIRRNGSRAAVVMLGTQNDPGLLNVDPGVVLAIMRKPFDLETLVQIVGALCEKLRGDFTPSSDQHPTRYTEN